MRKVELLPTGDGEAGYGPDMVSLFDLLKQVNLIQLTVSGLFTGIYSLYFFMFFYYVPVCMKKELDNILRSHKM